MKFICESTESSPLSLVGGKGSHLQNLHKWNAPVPSFFVVSTDVFHFYRENEELPGQLRKRFHEFFKEHPLIALRSSMISEDQVDSSFAGLFETLLDVTQENWEESLIRIFNSVNSSRVTEYLRKKNLEVDLQMAVVAQALVKVDKSGVVFSRSPVIPTAVVAIDAAFGMGEGVVSGHADVDNYMLTRTRELVKATIVNTPTVLSETEQLQILDLALLLEEKAGTPSDIEWGYKDHQLIVFQIRPITREFQPIHYFVDTNLSESYPGVVSPFTGAFVKKAYENVFQESAHLLGARNERFSQLSYHYARLISSVDNHLYYNLEHYYAALRALPGGEKNIENWHKMIGGKIEGSKVPYHATELTRFETLKSFLFLGGMALRRKKIFGKFLSDLESLREEIEVRSLSLTTPHETIRFLYELINRRIGFGLTVINDVFIMIGLGILSKEIKKCGLPDDAVIDLLKTDQGVDSTKPLQHFNHLVTNMSQDFLERFLSTSLSPGHAPYDKELARLADEGFGEDVMRLKEFLSLYGDRSFEELKLESLPLRNNPDLLKELIVWTRKNPSRVEARRASSHVVELSWPHQKILRFTREAIAMREATRLWRGKFYHLLRELILKLAFQLKQSDSTWEILSISDFFSLTPEEWLNFSQGKLSPHYALDLIISRRDWQTKKQTYPEVIPWVESEPLPSMMMEAGSSPLQGQGVSPGVTEGTALVLENPQDALGTNFSDFILVTKNTDPAWVYIMSRSKGLISEKGSLLSHTAIIGRELRIPTIVGVRHATQKLKTGDRLKIDAQKGTIEVQ
jgi:phosphohistidine swiveling domain-containing protein